MAWPEPLSPTMTDISFHVHLPDKMRYACRLLRKAVSQGSRVCVVGEAPLLHQLDALLWTFSPLDFVPHCLADASPQQLEASAVVLGLPEEQELPVVVNLGRQAPAGFEKFQRLIELVGSDDEDIQAGRQRWKIYKQAGLEPVRHEAAQAPAAN